MSPRADALPYALEWPEEHGGGAPDDLVDAMTRVGFDLGPRGEDPSVAGRLALAEELTGVRVTAGLLARDTCLTGHAGRPPGRATEPHRPGVPAFRDTGAAS
ncbi:DUF6461 domain-containing protein [Streptomyces sp. NPDC005820]|uniref:DUF6461 domain-containing protein n=1 Tax=Streptomyces sp. NPDC005820 TaxID=3157069 RepID=UPI0033E9676E